jgi:tripartite-type tricarboxylate transporter receptor subunit TctC
MRAGQEPGETPNVHDRAHPIIDRCLDIGRSGLVGLALVGLVLAGLALAATGAAMAQAQWPTRNVTVVVPYAAGGNTDIMARMASQKLAEAFGQSFIVDNRVGAGGALAAGYVAQAAPDGYTLFFAAAPVIAVLPHIQKVNFDPHKDFTPVSVFGTGPFVLAIASRIPAHTIPEFVAYGKAHPLAYGSGGTGSLGHLAGALFLARAGLDAVHVPFRGGGPAMAALLGGQVDMYFGNASEIVPAAGNSAIRILGVATDTRMRQLPQIPTVSEFYPDFALSAWNGFMVPAKTPREIVDKLAAQVIAAAHDPTVIARLADLGIEANGTTPDAFAAQIAREQPQFDLAIKAAKLGEH